MFFWICCGHSEVRFGEIILGAAQEIDHTSETDI